MKIIENILDIESPFGLTIGNFDGLHLGHQILIKKLINLCKNKSIDSAVMTFSPHPSEILFPEKDNFLLNTHNEKIELFKSFGIDYLIIIPFTRDFSTTSPEVFLNDFVLSNNKLSLIHLGYDFAFGENKKGDQDFIKNYLKNKSIQITTEEKYLHDKEVISSTRIRESVSNGDFENVSRLLGRNYFVDSVIVKGQGRGKQIGFPTANIKTDKKRIYPGIGVYITQTRYQGMLYHSITNVGVNPTFEDNLSINIETNIFDFDKDIYGENIQVEFIKKVRDEQKFLSVNELVAQIRLDVQKAKDYFKNA